MELEDARRCDSGRDTSNETITRQFTEDEALSWWRRHYIAGEWVHSVLWRCSHTA